MVMEIPAGTVIIQEGEHNMDMYKILEGNVELYTGYGTKDETILGIQSKDSYFGEVGLLAEMPAIYTVVAFSDLVVQRITMTEITAYFKDNHEDALAIMKKLAKSMYSLKFSMESYANDKELQGKMGKNPAGFFAKEFSKYNTK